MSDLPPMCAHYKNPIERWLSPGPFCDRRAGPGLTWCWKHDPARIRKREVKAVLSTFTVAELKEELARREKTT